MRTQLGYLWGAGTWKYGRVTDLTKVREAKRFFSIVTETHGQTEPVTGKFQVVFLLRANSSVTAGNLCVFAIGHC